MCGINGFIDLKNNLSPDIIHNIVCKMNNCIIHRGPDAEGIYDGKNFSMGMRRLSILDLKGGNQPIFSNDKSKVVVFNGEIYNYKLLKKELMKKGYNFHTTSDTEVIVNLFSEYGEDAFAKLDGMFAFSLFDSITEKIYIVRDRMGEKPLYYTNQNGCIIYGSELKSIIATGKINKKINTTALNLFIQYSYIPSPLSIFENIYKVNPGNYIVIDKKGIISNHTYWELKLNKEYSSLSYDETILELQRRLEHSVKERMNCDVKYGAFLSGGFDSGTISALMAKNSANSINTFTIGFEDKEFDERKYAAQMAKHIGANHHEYILKYSEAIGIINKIIENMDEPFGDPSVIPEYLVSFLAAKEVKVILTGDAGDELFLGYEKYLINYYADKYMTIPKIIRKYAIEPAVKILPDTSKLSRKVNKVIKNAYCDIFDRRNRMMQLGFKNFECEELFTNDFFNQDGQKLISDTYNNGGSEIQNTQYLDLKIVLEGNMLAKVDRMSMLNSLEIRTPLLSNDIVEFAYSLPVNYKIDGKNKKKIFKDSFRTLFPKDFDKLPKSGFSIPLEKWIRNEMKEEILSVLNRENIKKQKIFNYEYINQILREHFSGKVNRNRELWNLYLFEKWYYKYINE